MPLRDKCARRKSSSLARGKPNCRRLGSGDSARKKGLFRFLRRQPICQAAFNGEFGNSGDASVHADAAKSKFPKRVARALRGRNSLRMATQLRGRACPCYRFCDCGPHSAETDQSGETVSLISLSLRSQFHFVARPNVGRVYSRSRDAAIRVYNAVGNVIQTHENKGDFKE